MGTPKDTLLRIQIVSAVSLVYLRSTTYILAIVSTNMARLAPNKSNKPRKQVTSASRATRSNDGKGEKTTNTVCILTDHLDLIKSKQIKNNNNILT